MRKHVGKVKVAKAVKTKLSLGLESEDEHELFARLKTKRLEIAKAQNVPPYVVFHDKTLFEMIKLRPKNLADLGGITGVGEAKIKKYGKVFLEVLGA